MQCTIGCCGHRRKKKMKIYGLVRLTKDAEVRYSQAAQPMAIASFSVAAPRKFRKEGEPEADFFDCVAFGGKAEFISKYFKKGSRAFIEGDLRNDNYVNKEGIKVYRNRLYIEEIDFADSKGDNTAATPAQTPQTAQTQQRAAAPAQTRQAAPQAQGYAKAPAPAPAAPAQAPAKRTATKKAAAPAQAPAQAPAADGFMAIPEGMGEMPWLN